MLIESMNFSQMIENFFNIPEGPDAFMIGFMCILAVFVVIMFIGCLLDYKMSESKTKHVTFPLELCYIFISFLCIGYAFMIPVSCQPDDLSILPVADTYALNEDTVALQVTSYDRYIPTGLVNNCRVSCATAPNTIMCVDGTFTTTDNDCGFARFCSGRYATVVHFESDNCDCNEQDLTNSAVIYGANSFYREWLNQQDPENSPYVEIEGYTCIPIDEVSDQVTISVDIASNSTCVK